MIDISNINILYKAFQRIYKCSSWKTQTQLYQEKLMFNLNSLSKRLKEGKYVPGKRTKFVINERGKTRCIEASCIDDRIVQAALCDNVLIPLCTPHLIYDNAASLKGKGTDFFRRELKHHLRSFGQKHKNNGYILKVDFSKFFDNIQHEIFLQTLKNFGLDDEGLAFMRIILKQYEVDVSYLTPEEYSVCMDQVFDSLNYIQIDKHLLTGEKFMSKSLAIGSAVAQVAGISVPYRIDNYCKIVRGIKYYGRYMDDFYIISESKEYLQELLVEITKISKQLGLFLNTKKTQIIKLNHWFTILKTQYKLNDDGRVIEKPLPEHFSRERRKIRLLVKTGIPEQKIRDMYRCWRGGIIKRFGECKSLQNTDQYFTKIMEEYSHGIKRRRKRSEDRNA